MGKLKEYIRENIILFAWTFFILLIFKFVFYLANLNTKIYNIAFLSIITIFFILITINFINFKKSQNKDKEIAKLKANLLNLNKAYIEYKTDTSDYFMMLVHQIKTPITASSLLLEDENISKDELKKQIMYIENYVNMLLTFLKLIDTKTDMDIYKIDLDKVIKEIIRKYSILFISKGVQLEYNIENVKVISDSRWLSILIEQIISNAIKYTEKGKIKIYFKEDTLYIKDTGKGIKKEDINKIFDMGYSGFNGRINQKSSGLGLYLAKKIAIKLNIDITVKSELHSGTEFAIKFNPDIV
ncbi:MAG: histidine kinase [Clostridiales bacterium]|nr:MAG: histidine kinase [Clostridiales bacterium]